MARPLMGYLAGAAFVLSTVGAAAAYAQSGGSASAQIAQSQATADSHAGASVQIDHADRADRDAERVQRDKERTAERLERQQDRVKEQHERIERVEMRHGADATQHLRTMLQLKPGQEAALQAYVAAIHPAHGAEHIVEMSSHGEARTTTQKLADMEKRLADQNAQAKARIDATRRFYDQLDPSQKKVFDEMPLPGPMMIMPGLGNMRVMVSMDGLPHMGRMPPLPPLPPVPPAPPAPPRLD